MHEQLSLSFVSGLVAGLRSVLGSDLAAVYLYGSAVAAGFDVSVSDIDLLVVTEGELDDAAVGRLDAFQSEVVEHHPDWDDRLELVYVARKTLASFRDGGSLAVISPGEPFHVRDGVELWIANFFLVREAGIALVGPSARDVIPPISQDEFIAEVRRYAGEVRTRDLRTARPADRAYNVLSVCRALATIALNKPCSKQQGAALVRARMPDWAWLIDEAEQCRLARGGSGFTDEATIGAAEAFMSSVGDEIVGSFRR